MTSAAQERLIEQALTLVVQADAAPDPLAERARQALGLWPRRSAAHEDALKEAHRRWHALGGMADDLRAHFYEPLAAGAPEVAARQRRQRRRLLLSVVGLLGTGALAGRGVQWYWQQPVFIAAYQTRSAEKLEVALPDGANAGPGSRMALAPLTLVEARLYRQRRVVEMARGEVRFDVEPDRERRFEVHTRAARIEVVGTVFTVRDRGGAVTVGVEHGHVRVSVQGNGTGGEPVDARAPPIDLLPGQVIDIHNGRAEPVRTADATTLSAWRDGWLVFDNTPLGEALGSINAWRRTPIVAADARVAALRLSGRFRTSESAALLAALPGILPLTAGGRPDGSVELRLR